MYKPYVHEVENDFIKVDLPIPVKEIKLDKKAFPTVPLFDESADKAFWLSQSPQARIN